MIRLLPLLALLGCAAGTAPDPKEDRRPLSLHPDNPRVFLWRGRPTLLIGSGEHYGAVLNLDFDYATYLRTLQADGLNHTRLWAGTYREVPGSFGITDYTLAPGPGRYIAPWARSDQPGYAHGGPKFDLARWDPAFFERLRDFLRTASECGVVVEVNLWCPNYDEALWKASPLHPDNNVNGVGLGPDGKPVPRDEVYTLKHPRLLEVQLETTRKIVRELAPFDNLYFEICNEPYFGGVTLEWQHRIADAIVEAERDLPHKHLISQNIANGRAKVVNPHPAVSILNFHYCVPPDAVALNWALGKPIGENETGFRGKDDVLYRTEGWDFILAGGALYSHLDYSFTTQNPQGTFLDYRSPGGGSPALRRQLGILKKFMEGFDFVRMAPAPEVLRRVSPQDLEARVLAEPGRQYAAYVHVPLGGRNFSARWSGLLEPRYSETYTFTATADDGVRLWIDGRPVIDRWTDSPPRDDSGTIALEAGKKVPFVLEYYQRAGGAVLRLAWSSPSQKKQIIPRDRFRLPDGSGPGLKAEYFEGTDLRQLRATRTDASLQFDWSNLGPFGRDLAERRAELVLDLPAGRYAAEWINPRTGACDGREEFDHPGGERRLATPPFVEDLALRLRRPL